MNLAQQGTIISVRQVARRTVEVVIKVSDGFSFAAGQYIWLAIPELKYPDPKGNARMFSIVSAPTHGGELTILFRASDSGYKKTLTEMAHGTEITFSGPFGSMGLPENKSTPVIFLAGGVGVAPFLSMIKFATETDPHRTITLLYANAEKEEVAYLDELEQTGKENPNFRLIPVLGPMGKDQLTEFIGKDASWFVSGPRDFVNIASKLLDESGVPSEKINFEQFYPDAASIMDLGNDPYLLAIKNSNNHFILTDSNGLILYANKAAEETTGYTFAEMAGNTPRLWGGLMPADFYRNLWRTIKQDRRPFYGEIRNRRKNQEEYFALARISPIIDKDDNLLGFVATEEDITSLKQIQKKLESETIAVKNAFDDLKFEKLQIEVAEAKEEAILMAIGDGLIVTDEKGNITLINKAAEALFHTNSEEIMGKAFTEIVPFENKEGDLILPEKHPFRVALTTTTTTVTRDDCLYYVRSDKTKLPVAITTASIILGGKLIGVVEIFRDITQEIEIERAKNEFVSLASHQLRTPPSIIGWYTETLQSGELGSINEKQAEYLDEIYKANHRMIAVINSLLNISRIEMGTFSISPKEIRIEDVINETLEELAARFNRKNLEVKKSYDPALDSFMADPNIIQIIIDNLISNAFKYSPSDNTKIEINTKKNDDCLLLSVKDNGIGILSKDKEKIFQKLFRADNAVSADPDGTGLGLYMTKKIVAEGLGGKIWFDSQNGEGATFYVSIPIAGMKEKSGTTKLVKP